MKKGLQIAILIVAGLILSLLLYLAVSQRVWVIEGLNGADGSDGEDGDAGKSAYELAKEDGFTGSMHEWLVSLAVKGEDGRDGKNGADGQNGVSVRDVRVGSDGSLFVTLTNGVVLNAGKVSAGEEISDEPDEEGFVPVYEMVTVENCTALNLREGPGAGYPSVNVVSAGTELLRIGVNETIGTVGWSRVVCEKDGVPVVCYASSYYLNLKYIYDGELPTVLLPESLTLTVGKTAQFVYSQMVPDLPDHMRVQLTYSGSGERIYNGKEVFCLTPDTVGSETLTLAIELWARDDWRAAYRREVAVTVVEDQADLSARTLVIGDRYAADAGFLSALRTEIPGLTLLGTQHTSELYAHEGYAGAGAEEFLSSNKIAGKTNPFYDPAVGAFHWNHYLEQNALSSVDVVVLYFGETEKHTAEEVVALANAIHQADAEVKVIILTAPAFPSDGYYLTSHTDLSVGRIRVLQYAATVDLLDACGTFNPGVSLLPSYLCINDKGDRQTVTVDGKVYVSDLFGLSESGNRRIAMLLSAHLSRVLAP